jgi:hypothetical protein
MKSIDASLPGGYKSDLGKLELRTEMEDSVSK